MDPSIWNAGLERSGANLYPRLSGTRSADVCVVGLGGSGLTAVHALLDRGASVVAVDARQVASGAAGRNGGLLLAGLAPFYHDAAEALGRDRAKAFYLATMDEQDRIAAATPDHVRRTGSLRIAEDAAELEDCRAQREAMGQDGLPVEPHSGPFGEGLRFPTDLCFQPYARARALASRAVSRGAALFEDSGAVDISADGVRTERGEVRAGRVIVAVDGGLDKALPELSPRVRTARLQMIGTEPASDVTLDTPMYLRYGYEYVQQLKDGSLALGGFRDRFEAAEWTHEGAPTDEVQGLLESFLRTRMGTSARITHRWAASVGYTEGPLPIFEELRGGVIAAGGYSGTGNLVGALAGRAAAAWALGGSSPELDLFRPE